MALDDYRVIDYPEKTSVDNTDFVMTDSESNGTNKYQVSRIITEAEAKVAAAVAAEAEAREAADEALQTDIDTRATSAELAAEATAREEADNALKADLFFLADTQKKLFLSKSIDTTVYTDISVNMPAGTYKMTADSFVTSDTDASKCRVFFQNNNSDILVIDVARNKAIDRTITLNSAINRVRIYAGTNYSTSVGDTLIVSNLMFSHDSVLNERITANEEGITSLDRVKPIVGITDNLVGTATSGGAYSLTTVLGNLTLENDKLYEVTFSIDNAVSSAVYVYLKDSNNDTISGGGTTIPVGQTSVTYYIPIYAEYTNAKLCFEVGFANFTVSASIREYIREDYVSSVSDVFSDYLNTGTYNFDVNAFTRGGILNGVLNSWRYRASTFKSLVCNRSLTVYVDDGYRFVVSRYYDGSWHDSKWITSSYGIQANSTFRISIAKVNEDQSIPADVEAFVSAVHVKSFIVDNSTNLANASVIGGLFKTDKFFSHIGIDKNDNIIIPCQSVADVSRSRRLGFKVMELNVRKTSDNKYVCLHGNQGAFGYQFEDVNGNPVTNVAVDSLTLQEIKDTIRYKSIYPKYRTAPFTLQEMLYECKKLGVIPLVEYQPAYSDEIGILDEIMGKNNYILSIYNADRANITDAPVASWLAINDTDALVNKCNASGGLYIAGINATASAFSGFTIENWKELVNAVHDAGYLVSFVSGYTGEIISQRLLSVGFDISGSAWNINDFEVGNLCNLFADANFADFDTNGTVTNGTLALSTNNTIEPNETLPSVFLGGGNLHITFNGSIEVKFGDYINSIFTSDGSSEMWFSTFFEESVPTFTITAKSNTEVYDITYKASRM